MIAGINMYTIIAGLVAAALLFHFTSKEETMLAMIAVVAVIYLTR